MSNQMRAPVEGQYDVVIIGGAIMGSSTAWWLSQNPDFDGRILVVERDPTYETASTTHTNSCIRQQYSNALNVKISQFGWRGFICRLSRASALRGSSRRRRRWRKSFR